LAVDAQILRDSVLAGAMHGIVAVTCVRATATIPASHRVRCPPGGDGASEFEMRRRLAAASSSRLRRLGDFDEDCRQRRKGNGDRACSGHPGCLAQANRPPPIHRAGGRWSGWISSVDTAMPSSLPPRRRCCAGVVRVGVARGAAAGSRRPALVHGIVAAILVTGSPQPDNLHAKRKSRIIFLGPGLPSRQNRPDC
jgi:hypothetical protein